MERQAPVELRGIYYDAMDEELVKSDPSILRQIQRIAMGIIIDTRNRTQELISNGSVGLAPGGDGRVMQASNVREAAGQENFNATFAQKTIRLTKNGEQVEVGPIVTPDNGMVK
jgi:hypothetical protein